MAVLALHPERLHETGFGEEMIVRDARGYDRGSSLRFEYDACFAPAATQEQVFEQVRPLVTSFLDGYSVCIFAYGQTGSGKTFTMQGGSDNNMGINGRTLREAFAIAEERRTATDDASFEFSVSYLEVYMETVRDLLAPDGSGASLEVRQSKEGRMHVPGLTSLRLENAEELDAIVALGARRRHVGSHRMNDVSSRSHAILTVTCVASEGGKSCASKLHLVDLAGSERVAKTHADGERLKEANAINKSLSSLGDVITALIAKKAAEQQGKGDSKGGHHVPFRNSKLTYFLSESLSGSAKVLMICNIAPTLSHVGETICSLNFASRCRAVQLGVASKGGGDRCRRLEERVMELELQLRDKENTFSRENAHQGVATRKAHLQKPRASGMSGL